jgi:zinc D-Ala-D-Ala carboxypeptidase
MKTITVEDWLLTMAGGIIDLRVDNSELARQALQALDLKPTPAPPPQSDQLSPNFTLTELTYSDTAEALGIDNTPDDDALEQLSQLANDTLEKIRTLCGNNAVFISSGFRCATLNAAIGGASNSAHLYGCAADFTIPDFGSVEDVCRAIEPHLAEFGIDQLINETGGGARWVHVGRAIPPSTTPRCECLTITNGQTIAGIV